MRLRTITTAALGGLAISLLTAPPAWADTFQVNTIADRVDANIGDGVCADARGRCSLRAAVQEANSNPDADTITLGAVRYRLTLAGAGEDAAASGDLDVTSTITITGAGSTVDATGNDRVFDVQRRHAHRRGQHVRQQHRDPRRWRHRGQRGYDGGPPQHPVEQLDRVRTR
ncbi:MAG: CSLREA domain-containing protein [Geodermatophilaceae bacterium]|nr:CSLREA domain-containing protein [Geodermatophilaceae bacterium]